MKISRLVFEGDSVGQVSQMLLLGLSFDFM